jgi:hypothetical protein
MISAARRAGSSRGFRERELTEAKGVVGSSVRRSLKESMLSLLLLAPSRSWGTPKCGSRRRMKDCGQQ